MKNLHIRLQDIKIASGLYWYIDLNAQVDSPQAHMVTRIMVQMTETRM